MSGTRPGAGRPDGRRRRALRGGAHPRRGRGDRRQRSAPSRSSSPWSPARRTRRRARRSAGPSGCGWPARPPRARSCGCWPPPRGGPGFPAALEELISELQAALVDPVALRGARRPRRATYEREVAALYESYCGVRDELGRHDDHSRRRRGDRGAAGEAGGLGTRPVFLYGFDDLTGRAARARPRARPAHAQVTVALPWEDREALTARARRALRAAQGHRGRRRSSGSRPSPGSPAAPRCSSSSAASARPARASRSRTTAASPCSPRRASSPRSRPSAPRSRGCSHDGVAAGEIAIVLRDPRLGRAPLPAGCWRASAFRSPCRPTWPPPRTATGAGLIALLQAAVGRRRRLGPARLPAHPRASPRPRAVDWFERRLLRGRLRTADEALEAWSAGSENGDAGLREVRKLREAKPGAGAAARGRAAGPLDRRVGDPAPGRRGRGGPGPGAAGRRRDRAARSVELAELGLPALRRPT